VRVLDLGQNLQFARGYNAALAQVPHPWVALVNNDAELSPDWLERLLAATSKEPRAAFLGGKLLFQAAAGGQTTIQSAGASFTDGGAGFEIGWGQPDHGQYDQARPVGAIPGAAMLARHAVFDELGGFDGAYGAYLEDVDLCWRAWLRGYSVEYVPAAVAYHHYGASGGGRASPYRIRLMQRNRLATALKNLSAASLPLALAVSLAYDAYRMLEYTLHGQPGAVGALLHGTLDFFRAIGPTLSARRIVQHNRVLSDGALRRQGLLISALAAFREYRRLGSTHQPAPVAAPQQ
jgi:GT2 family glycosyltransferase